MPIPLIERLQRTFPSAWFADARGPTETVSGDTFPDRDSTVTKLGRVGPRPPPSRAGGSTLKVPQAVTFVDALPRIPSGKVPKRERRAT